MGINLVSAICFTNTIRLFLIGINLISAICLTNTIRLLFGISLEHACDKRYFEKGIIILMVVSLIFTSNVKNGLFRGPLVPSGVSPVPASADGRKKR
jgi:hypothetical protein